MEHIQNIAWIGFFIAASAMDGDHWEKLLALCGLFLAVAVGINIFAGSDPGSEKGEEL